MRHDERLRQTTCSLHSTMRTAYDLTGWHYSSYFTNSTARAAQMHDILATDGSIRCVAMASRSVGCSIERRDCDRSARRDCDVLIARIVASRVATPIARLIACCVRDIAMQHVARSIARATVVRKCHDSRSICSRALPVADDAYRILIIDVRSHSDAYDVPLRRLPDRR